MVLQHTVSLHHLNSPVDILHLSLSHPVSYILPPLTPPVFPPPTPFPIVCTSILLSLPCYPALHKEEAALPLPPSLVRTILAWSLTPVSLSPLSLSETQTT